MIGWASEANLCVVLSYSEGVCTSLCRPGVVAAATATAATERRSGGGGGKGEGGRKVGRRRRRKRSDGSRRQAGVERLTSAKD